MITLTWFGTATVLLEVDGPKGTEKLLFDPFFRMNKRLPQPKLEEFCNVDYIFNTHPHFDHLRDVPRILQHTNAKLFGTATAFLRLEEQGVDVENKVEILCPHEKLQTKNATVALHRSKHVKNDVGIILQTAAKILFTFRAHRALAILGEHHHFTMGGDIVAFQVDAHGKTILIFGSAGFDNRALLPQKVDVLVWPFQGRTGMTKYSLPIIEKINPKVVILDHFDNAFPPITSSVNVEKFVRIMHKKHPQIKVIVPEYKQKIIIQ